MMETAVPKMSKEDREREERYQAESDLRTLSEANAIRRDKKRLARAQKMAKEMADSVGTTVLTG